MIDCIKESFQINIDYPLITIIDFAQRFNNSHFRITIGPKSIAISMKLFFIDRTENLRNCLLNHSVYDCWYPKQSFSTIRFRNFYSQNWFWLVGSFSYLSF